MGESPARKLFTGDIVPTQSQKGLSKNLVRLFKFRCSQYIADDADRPHVRFHTNGFIVNDLWRYKLWGAKKHTNWSTRHQLLRQAEVNDLDAM